MYVWLWFWSICVCIISWFVCYLLYDNKWLLVSRGWSIHFSSVLTRMPVISVHTAQSQYMTPSLTHYLDDPWPYDHDCVNLQTTNCTHLSHTLSMLYGTTDHTPLSIHMYMYMYNSSMTIGTLKNTGNKRHGFVMDIHRHPAHASSQLKSVATGF